MDEELNNIKITLVYIFENILLIICDQILKNCVRVTDCWSFYIPLAVKDIYTENLAYGHILSR